MVLNVADELLECVRLRSRKIFLVYLVTLRMVEIMIGNLSPIPIIEIPNRLLGVIHKVQQQPMHLC
jgi:hypothetical protein